MRLATHEFSLSQLRRAASATPMLDADRERMLLEQVRSGEAAALGELLEAHLRLVVAVAARFSRAGVSLAELVAEGNLGLVEAARRFDAEKGVRFSSYAAWWVRARISRFAMGNRRIVAPPSTRNARRLFATMRSAERRLAQQTGVRPTAEQLAHATGTTVEDVRMVEAALSSRDVAVGPFDDGAAIELGCDRPSPEEALGAHEESRLREDRVTRALSKLDRREREIVKRRFLEDAEETLSAIGEVLGLSRERVRQLETRAKEKLREDLLEVA